MTEPVLVKTAGVVVDPVSEIAKELVFFLEVFDCLV